MTHFKAHRFLISFFVLILVFLATGCRDETLIPDECMFELTVSEIQTVYSVGEEITVQATLANLSNTMFVLRYGASFPRIALEGEILIVNTILIQEELKGTERIVESRTFVFEEPGTYQVDVTAGFAILSKEYAYAVEIEIVVE